MQSIFVHGLGQLSSSWLPVLSHLPANIPADCPDLTSLLACQEITYPGLYQAFSDYCDQQNSPLYLCGLSLGAVLSLNYTVEHPQKVKSLILIAPQYKMPRLLLSFQNVIFRLLPKRFFQTMGFPKKEVLSLTRSMKTLDFTSSVSSISCPVLILCGSKDHANQKAARTLAALIPGSRFVLAESAGHELNLDTPEMLAAMITDFWNLHQS